MRGAMQKRKTNRKGGGWMGGDLAGLGPKVRGAKPQAATFLASCLSSKPRERAVSDSRFLLQGVNLYLLALPEGSLIKSNTLRSQKRGDAEIRDRCRARSLLKVGCWVAAGSRALTKLSHRCIEVDYRTTPEHQALAGREWSGGGAGRQCRGISRKQHVIR